MQILDGRLVARNIKENLKDKVKALHEKLGFPPHLAVLQVGENPASEIYIQQKIKGGKEVGIESKKFSFPADVSAKTLRENIEKLNKDLHVHAILVQLPLPASLSASEIVSWIDPQKDPDCLTNKNQGLFWSGGGFVSPCTPAGIIKLLEYYDIPLQSRRAVVVGRSQIVGLPMAKLLLHANATVTVCHSYSKNLSQITSQADILVVATGQPEFLGKNHFQEGAVVVDVGIHRIQSGGKSKLVGDVRFEELKNWASFASPVPGGVGPMTVAMLLENTWKLASLQKGK